MHRFHAPSLESGDERVVLSADEATHLTRVLRLGPGVEVRVFNGRGIERVAIVEAAQRHEVTLRVTAPATAARELSFGLTLAQAVLKGDAMEHVVRDATMIGATAILPIVSARSEMSLAQLERGRRRERWERIAISSAKQSRRAVVPEIGPASTVSAALGRARDTVVLMLIEPSALSRAAASSTSGIGEHPDGRPVSVFVGPEGGWTDTEIAEAVAAGARLVTLGDRTLRADAVALVTLPVLLYAWGEL
jgi:16S rRNA (uracil1498-N3)-methyltransferase